MRQTSFWRYGSVVLAAGTAALMTTTAAFAQTVPVTVTAAAHDYHEVPVSVVVPAGRVSAALPPSRLPKDATPCQSEPAGAGRVRLTWMVRDLKRGEVRTYQLAPAQAAAGSGVEVRRDGENVDIFVDGQRVTRYDTTTGPNKPYFYPVNAPGGKQIVRHWPVEPSKLPGETSDHPHHRGISFTHGALNGVDFWLEGSEKAGKTVHTGYATIASGPVYGKMVSRTDWILPDGKKIAEDRREVRVYLAQDGYLMDVTIAVKAVNGPLHWGDTKEGTFAVRVADSLRPNAGKGKVGEGHIVNANGDKQAAAWGKAAAWCDYYGPVDGETVGVAIFDHPQNLRHPTTWHVRDYGLFAVNPFGLHDFDPAHKNNPKAGDHVTPDGQTTTFRYRLFLHRGTTEAARVGAVWTAYAEPPGVELVAPPVAEAGAWQVLFDGKSLAGWERKAVHGGNGGLWEVQRGLLTGNQEPDHKGGLLGTTRAFGDYEIELQFQIDYPADSGLFLRTTPTGDAYQITLDHKPDGLIGSIYVPSSGFVAQDPSWQKKFKQDGWNRLRARITGQPARIQVWLNDQPTVDFTDDRERLPREGYVGLQVHGGSGSWGDSSRVRFRSIRIRPLPSTGKE